MKKDTNYMTKREIKECFEIPERIVDKYLVSKKSAFNRYCKTRPVKLFLVEDVYNLLSTPGFETDMEKYRERQERQRKGAQ